MAGELVFVCPTFHLNTLTNTTLDHRSNRLYRFRRPPPSLQSGYRVRISIRKESQIRSLSAHALISPYVAQGKVEFVVVPDITVPGAFDEALKDVVYVEHLASQLPGPVSLLVHPRDQS
jgi:hypothetical protein